MHQSLCGRFPAFRARIEECDALLREHATWSLTAEWDDPGPDSRFERGDIEVVQTSIFAMQVALADAWKSWGITPYAVVGHSMGEVAAAYVAGALDLPEALRVTVHRSRLLQRALDESSRDGAMAAVRISAERAKQLIEESGHGVSIAVHNSPKYTVLAGKADVLKDLLKRLREQKIGGRLMSVPGAAHTPELEPTRWKLEAALAGLQPRTASVPFYSAIAGARIDGERLDAAYWGSSVCRPVQFAPAIDRLLDDDYRLFVELGPHPLLCAAITQCAQHRELDAAAVPSLRRDDHDLDALLQALGTLYVQGFEVPWKRIHPGGPRPWISLPTYPWQRQRCWLEPPTNGKPNTDGDPSVHAGNGNGAGHPLLGPEIELAVDPHVHCWNSRVSVERVPYLREYQLQNVVAFPVAACLEAAEAAAEKSLGGECHVIENIRFDRALVFDYQAEEAVQLVLETNGSEKAHFRLFSKQPNGSWQLHTSGSVRPLRPDEQAPSPDGRLRKEIEAALAASRVESRGVRAESERGRTTNGGLTCTYEAWRDGNQVLARTGLPQQAVSEAHGYAIHPALLDACLAVMGSAGNGKLPHSSVRYVPTAVGQLRWYANPRPSGTLWTHAVCEPHQENNGDIVCGSVHVWDDEQQPVFEVSGLELRRIPVEKSADTVAPPDAADGPRGGDAGKTVELEALRLLEAFRTADGPRRKACLSEYLRARIACTLDTQPQQIDTARPLTLLGIDSLMAMEIKNRVETELNTEVPIVTVLEGPTIAELAKILLEQVDREASQPAPTADDRRTAGQTDTEVAGEEAAQLLEQLDELSEEDVDALMHRMLAEKRNDK
jgi:acyl transferase domain-containing protein